MARKAKKDYTHDDIFEVLNRPVDKDPASFPHWLNAIMHNNPYVGTQYPYAPRMAKINKDIQKKFIVNDLNEYNHYPPTRVLIEPLEYADLPIELIKPFLGKITINDIPMFGILFDNSVNADGAIIHLGLLYLDPTNMVRCYIPEDGNAMNPMPDNKYNYHGQTEHGYEFLERFGDVQWFKDADRFDAKIQQLLYDPDAIIADVQKRIVKGNK